MKNKSAKEILIAGSIALSALIMQGTDGIAGEVKQTPKITITQTELLVRDQKPISRSEMVANGLPLNMDAYFLAEIQGNSELYKLRAQTVPLNYGPFGLGISGQHVENVNGNKSAMHGEIGMVGRIMGKPLEDAFAKADIRYFPSKNIIDSYAFLGAKRIFLDELSSYNTETQQTMLRLGIDYKINKNFLVGIETKFTGSNQDLHSEYTALRAKATF